MKIHFTMEVHVGLRTYYRNLRSYISLQDTIVATWTELDYVGGNSRLATMPVFPNSIRSRMIGRDQVIRGVYDNPNADIYFFCTQVGAALASQVVARKPFVLCTDVTPAQYDRLASHYGHTPDGSGPISWYKNQVNRWLFQNAKLTICWSEWTANSLFHEYDVPRDKLAVIPPGVNIQKWHAAPLHPRSGPLRILFVGGDFERKGGNVLLEAFRRLPAGEAELAIVTRESVPETPNVKVYNNLSPNDQELIDLFNSCHVFAFPTFADTFGIAAIEASASGLPIVATNIAALPEIVQDGVTGLLFEPGNVDQLTHCLKTLLEDEDKRLQMSLQARKRALTKFDQDQNYASVLAALNRSHKNNVQIQLQKQTAT